MTLSTNVYVLDQVAPTEVFRLCQELLQKYDEDGRGPDRQRWSNRQDKTWRDGVAVVEPGNAWSLDNEPDQGLPAWLMMTYRPNGPLRTPEQSAQHDEDCGDECSGKWHERACWLDIDFDTAYGYRGPDGIGCGDLHARLVAELGQWLDGKGVRWEWRNEFTGDVHGGEDRYERLIELCSGGFEATAWMQTTVLPAIAMKMLTEGGES